MQVAALHPKLEKKVHSQIRYELKIVQAHHYFRKLIHDELILIEKSPPVQAELGQP